MCRQFFYLKCDDSSSCSLSRLHHCAAEVVNYNIINEIRKENEEVLKNPKNNELSLKGLKKVALAYVKEKLAKPITLEKLKSLLNQIQKPDGVLRIRQSIFSFREDDHYKQALLPINKKTSELKSNESIQHDKRIKKNAHSNYYSLDSTHCYRFSQNHEDSYSHLNNYGNGRCCRFIIPTNNASTCSHSY